MNSLVWKDNVDMIQEMVRELCNEEQVVCDYKVQVEFNSIIDSYSKNITHESQLTKVNKQILMDCMNHIQKEKSNNVPQQRTQQPEQPTEIYSRDAISKQKQDDITNKFNIAQQEFAKFNLKKPEDIIFNDVVEEDQSTIDERIERELKERNYDVPPLQQQPLPNTDSNTFLNDSDSDDNNGKLLFNPTSDTKKVSFNNTEKETMSFVNRLKKNNREIIPDNNDLYREIQAMKQDIKYIKNKIDILFDESVFVKRQQEDKELNTADATPATPIADGLSTAQDT